MSMHETPSSKLAAFHPLLVSLGVVVLGLWLVACAPQSPVNVNATVEAAVGTAVAKERDKPAPLSGREQWLRSGREFFLVEAEVKEIADGLSALFVTAATNSPKADASGFTRYFALKAKRTSVSDRLTLIPLPDTGDGRSIRSDLVRSGQALERFEAHLLELMRSVNLTPTPGSDRDKELRSDTFAAMTDQEDSWQAGRTKVLEILRQQGISMSDLELDKLPWPTPTPAKPTNKMLEINEDAPRKLPDGSSLIGGTVTNRDGYWSVTELEVLVTIKDTKGGADREEKAVVRRTTLAPGSSTNWEHTLPASEAPWYSGSAARWRWVPPNR